MKTILEASKCHTLDRHDWKAQQDKCGNTDAETWKAAIIANFTLDHYPYL